MNTIDKKFVAALWAVAACAVLVGFIVWQLLPAEDPVARNVNAPKVPYTACFCAEHPASADTAYMLIDLSDTTNWPHVYTNEAVIKSVSVQGAVSGAHHWDLGVGVILENDGTNGTMASFSDDHLESVSGIFDRMPRVFAEGGLSLRLDSEALVYAALSKQTESTTWQNDVLITATVGTSSTIAAGDVVIFADEVTDGSTLEFSVCVDYDTE